MSHLPPCRYFSRDLPSRFASAKSFGCLTSIWVEELTDTLKQLTSTLVLHARRAAAHRVIQMSTRVHPLISELQKSYVITGLDRDFTEPLKRRH